MDELLTFDPKKNKKVKVGIIVGDELRREVDPKHFMNVLQGYGIQEVAFEEITKRELKKIILVEKNTKKIWEAKVSDWILHGKVADYGHGKQRFLSVKFMNLKSSLKGGEM